MAMYAMDIEVRSNEDWVDSIALWLPDSEGAPTTEPFPLDPTWRVVQHLRDPNEALIPVFVSSSDNGRLEFTFDENTGGDITETLLQWSVPRSAAQYIPAGVYFHDIKFIDPDGGEIIFATGKLTMTTGTTRP